MSLRGAINAKCRECIYDPAGGNGNWRQQVTAFTTTNCPLYVVRPVSSGDRGVAVRAPVNNVNNVVEAQFPMSASKQIQPVPDAPPSSIDVLLAKISVAIDALASIEAVVKEMAQDNAKAEQARVRAQALMDELRNAGIVK